jgi:uncharacterized membrane protein
MAVMIKIKRVIKHTFAAGRKRVLSDAALERLSKAVAQGELGHSGEIRICVEARLPDSYLLRPHDMRRIVRQRAVAQFGKLRVWDTEHNNGVLIYLLLVEHAIEIVADRGISCHVSAQVWEGVVQRLAQQLKAGKFEQGLEQAVDDVASHLRLHFAAEQDGPNPNELPDIPHAV